ncbi:CPBP family intramembrane glutamic endopeptidase [Sphingomonas sp.]|uniref:CPBP family intramembrane glutamic endopeptidase n=1 Tax=Sphingomonas sp. TaxID=28214 RepID=UPI001ECF6949|nr:CPBP family intramembrane glutamic endopeptidase [Sphingomonas sp.]MBX3593172.1 CPBP family intramembrane metalloprotease [Sphingomonas sp.]
MQMNNMDIALALILLLGVPARALWRERSRRSRSRTARYGEAILTIAACLALLAFQWVAHDRSAAALGLVVPLRWTSWVYLSVAAALIGGLWIAVRRRPAGPAHGGDSPLPQTAGERQLFIVFGLVAGAGWELLYRGFLLWVLTPLAGSVGAVCVAATAYGVAHGVKDRRKLAGSLLSAFVFTIAYALTGDLWWLIVIHAGLPMLALAAPPAQAST